MKEAVSRGQFFLHEMAATYARKGMDGQKLVTLAHQPPAGLEPVSPIGSVPLVFASLARSGSIDLPLIE
eukprot:14420030-Alexandrium_andersonii.AAC.1